MMLNIFLAASLALPTEGALAIVVPLPIAAMKRMYTAM
jgi:hypothetical protein